MIDNHDIVFLAFSGGLDSTSLWSHFLGKQEFKNENIKPVFFYYGSTHNEQELNSALLISKHFGVDLDIVSLAQSHLFNKDSSALLNGSTKEIPREAYNVEGSLAATVVPGRNLVIASILAAKAEAFSLQTKQTKPVYAALAVHSGDHSLYPDCRIDFLTSLKETVIQSTENRVHIIAPFVKLDKSDIVYIGHKNEAPFHLTRSCYRSQEYACGTCGTCRERIAAFKANALSDPLIYE